MDAYSTYIKQLSDARLGELRREASEYALSRAAREHRAGWLRRASVRLRDMASAGDGTAPPVRTRPASMTRFEEAVQEELLEGTATTTAQACSSSSRPSSR